MFDRQAQPRHNFFTMLIVLELDIAAEGAWTGCRQTKPGKLARTNDDRRSKCQGESAHLSGTSLTTWRILTE